MPLLDLVAIKDRDFCAISLYMSCILANGMSVVLAVVVSSCPHVSIFLTITLVLTELIVVWHRWKSSGAYRSNSIRHWRVHCCVMRSCPTSVILSSLLLTISLVLTELIFISYFSILIIPCPRNIPSSRVDCCIISSRPTYLYKPLSFGSRDNVVTYHIPIVLHCEPRCALRLLWQFLLLLLLTSNYVQVAAPSLTLVLH